MDKNILDLNNNSFENLIVNSQTQNENINNQNKSSTQNQLFPVVFDDVNKHIYINTKFFKTNSLLLKCPFCKNVINTKIEKSFKKRDIFCLSFLFCITLSIYNTGLYFIGYKGIKSNCKDCLCFNVKHFCPYCNKLIYHYESA